MPHRDSTIVFDHEKEDYKKKEENEDKVKGQIQPEQKKKPFYTAFKQTLESIGHELIIPLGRGSYSYVFWIRDDNGSDYAVKLLDPDLIEDTRYSRVMKNMFVNEAEIHSQLLCHESMKGKIVEVYESYYNKDDFWFLRMELANTEISFQDIITDYEHYWLYDRLSMLAHIADILEDVHQRGIIHRDVKPQNILLGRDTRIKGSTGQIEGQEITAQYVEGHIKLSDFGFATRPDDPDQMLVGTPAYMSPEQIRGEVLDRRTDVYSLGVLMHEMLTGKHLRSEAEMESYDTLLKNLNPAPDLHGLARSGKEELEAICRRATSPERSERYGSMAELSFDLRSYISKNYNRESKSFLY